MYSQSIIQNEGLSQTKSKNKFPKEEPLYEISLNFNNNLFQAYLFEIFEKFKFTLIPNEIVYEEANISNAIRLTYNKEKFFIIFLDKETLVNWSSNNTLVPAVEKLQTITPSRNITVVLIEIPQNFSVEIEDEQVNKEEIIFYLNCELQVKVIDCSSNNDLVDFIANYIDSAVVKEDKSKITFFESKPIAATNLCEVENITDEKSIMFVKHLMCIPGISEKKAISVVKVYPDLISLMQIYKSEEYLDNEKENLLTDIEIEHRGKNTVKRFGGALSSKVYRTFYSENPNTIIN